MKKNLLPVIILLLSGLASCSKQAAAPVVGDTGADYCAQVPEKFARGSAIVRLSEGMAAEMEKRGSKGFLETPSAAFTKAMTDIGAIRMERLFPDAGEFEERHRAFGLHEWYRVEYEGYSYSEAQMILGQTEGISSVEPERKMQSTALFNDPKFDLQWDLRSIGIERVWKNFSCGGNEVVVCVEDSGVDMEHEDLKGVCLEPGADGSKCFINNNVGFKIVPNNHGTHVAGVIAAVNDNGKGICGIAGGREGKGGVRIMSCEILRPDPDDPDNADKTLQGNHYNAMVWAADHGAVICQNSWGYVYDNEEDAKNGGAGSMGRAIDYFIANAGVGLDGSQTGPMKGGVVFFAAGNEGWQYGWPAAYDGNGKCIAVGATSSRNLKAEYSNYGDWVDIWAPGGDAREGALVYSCITGSRYAGMQGTSMACPHASGVAALLVSYFGGPGFTNDMLVERLLGGADRKALPPMTNIGPLLDAYGAFTYGDKDAPESIVAYSHCVESDRVTWTLEVPSDSDKPAYSITMLAGESPETMTREFTFVIPPEASIGDTVSFSFNLGTFDKKYYASLFASDYQGNRSALTETVEILTSGNSSPEISTEYSGNFRVQAHKTLKIRYNISDPDGHEFTVALSPGSDAAVLEESDDRYEIVITGNAAPAGTYRAELTATDKHGAQTVLPIDYTLLENHSPIAVKSIDNILFVSMQDKVDIAGLSEYFVDEDGEKPLITTALSNGRIANLFVSGNVLVISPLAYGMTEAFLKATDACGASASIKFKILVRDTSVSLDLYPNPATDYIFIRPEKEGEYRIRITGATGCEVLGSRAFISPFEPLRLSLEGLSGGVYHMNVSGEGIEETYSFAKL